MAAVLKKEIQAILEHSKPNGWVLEPDAKRILEVSGIPVPHSRRVWQQEDQYTIDGIGGAEGIHSSDKIIIHGTSGKVYGIVQGCDLTNAASQSLF